MIYRSLRDELHYGSSACYQTPRGYSFKGRVDMGHCSFEWVEIDLLESHLAKADVFVDVGANIGYYTCLACSMGKRTVGIEPLECNLRYLYANIESNGWSDLVEVFPLGVSDRPGLAPLFGGGTGASLIEGWAGISPYYRKSISLSTLDILVGDRFAGKRIVIKMDVEGAEYFALQGGSKLLGITPKPVWLVEITLETNRQSIGHNPDFLKTFETFWQHGYTAYSVSNPQVKIEQSVIMEYVRTGNKPSYVSDNYIFVS